MRKREPKRHNHLIIGIIAILLSISTGCVEIEHPDWARFAEISGRGWDPDDLLIYEPVRADSLVPPETLYDFKIIMRSATRSQFSQLPMAVTIEDETGVVRADTIIIGGPEGPELDVKRAYGLKETSFILLKEIPLTDGFSITLSSLADPSQSKGLLNVGIEMWKSETFPSSHPAGIPDKLNKTD